MKTNNKIQIIIAILVVFLITVACGTSTTGEKVGDSSTMATSVPVQVETYKPGDVIKVDDYTITLNNAEIQGSKLIANFTFDNSNGSKEQAVSSLLSFSAKDTEGNKLDFSICSGSSLDGSVLAGDKLKGDICWDGVLPNSTVKIYYTASLLGKGAIVWQVPK